MPAVSIGACSISILRSISGRVDSEDSFDYTSHDNIFNIGLHSSDLLSQLRTQPKDKLKIVSTVATPPLFESSPPFPHFQIVGGKS